MKTPTSLIEQLRHACSVALGDLLALGMPAQADTGKLLLEAIVSAEDRLHAPSAPARAVAAWHALQPEQGLPFPPGWRQVDDKIYVFSPSRDGLFAVPEGWRLVEACIGLVDTDPSRSRMPLPRGQVDVVLPSGALLPIGGLVPNDVDVVKVLTPNMLGGCSNWAGIQLVFAEASEAEAPKERTP